MIRFALLWPLSTAILVLSLLFPDSRQAMRDLAFRLLGFDKFS